MHPWIFVSLFNQKLKNVCTNRPTLPARSLPWVKPVQPFQYIKPHTWDLRTTLEKNTQKHGQDPKGLSLQQVLNKQVIQLKYSEDNLLTQSFWGPGQVLLRHVSVRFDQVLYCHCSQCIDAGGHCTGVTWQQNHTQFSQRGTIIQIPFFTLSIPFYSTEL